MKHIFLDTNFVIDYLVRDEYRQISRQFLSLAKIKGCQFYISFLSVANFAYIARRLDKEILYKYIAPIEELFTILSNDSRQISAALSLNASDFEDALQYQTAVTNGCECIITRNGKDFKFSQIPVLSASDFMEEYLR